MLKWLYQWFSEKEDTDTESKENNRSGFLGRLSSSLRGGEDKDKNQSPGPGTEASSIREVALGGEVYRIDKKIGGGTFGQVYLAHRQRGELLVAVKEFDVSNAEAAMRFHREASILRDIDHPNIVKVLQTGMVDMTGYLVMEYLEGWSLGKIIRKRESKKLPLPLTTFTGIIRQLARALIVLEEKGAVHRDIKPDNILISPVGVAKLIDFGLLKAPGFSATLPDYILGTPNYISPEQVTGEKITVQADIYSLGATFYHMATGKLPFEGDTPQDVMKKHVKTKPTAPHTVVPEIPVKASKLILKMMEKKPQKRPAPKKLLESLNEVLDDLNQIKTKNPNNDTLGWT